MTAPSRRAVAGNVPARNVLLVVPVPWAGLWSTPLAERAPQLKLFVHGRDSYDAGAIDYAVGFRPPPGVLKTLSTAKAIFSLGAGVDGFLVDPEFPRHIPLVRFVHRSLSREMAQYVVMHVLLHHRRQRYFDRAQQEHKWRQSLPSRRTEETRIGIFGLGEIGTMAAERLRDLDFPVSGWSRTEKNVPGVTSFAGAGAMEAFLNQSDILVCLLPLTPDTRHILNKTTFSQLPKDAFVINAARGGHLVEQDLIEAIDSGHLAGAALDVFETEPLPETSPLWSHPAIAVTPHVAAMTDPVVMSETVIDGIARFERGEPLTNLVDFSRGY